MAYQVLVAAERRCPGASTSPGSLVVPAGVGGEIERLHPRCEERPPLRTLRAETGRAMAETA
jgi:hypothetical protein